MQKMEPLELPQVLDPTRYYHPPALFDDLEIEQENGEKQLVPIQDEEVPLIMAKYAVLQALQLPSDEETLVRVARGEGCRETFMSDIRKMQHSVYHGYEGMKKGDIELIAEGYGVYELVFPLDPKKMQEAEEAERLREEELRSDAEMVADAFDNISDDHLGLDQVFVNA